MVHRPSAKAIEDMSTGLLLQLAQLIQTGHLSQMVSRGFKLQMCYYGIMNQASALPGQPQHQWLSNQRQVIPELSMGLVLAGLKG